MANKKVAYALICSTCNEIIDTSISMAIFSNKTMAKENIKYQKENNPNFEDHPLELKVVLITIL